MRERELFGTLWPALLGRSRGRQWAKHIPLRRKCLSTRRACTYNLSRLPCSRTHTVLSVCWFFTILHERRFIDGLHVYTIHTLFFCTPLRSIFCFHSFGKKKKALWTVVISFTVLLTFTEKLKKFNYVYWEACASFPQF